MCAVGRKGGFGRVAGTPRGSERQRRNEVRYDEYPDLGCCRNCRIPDRVRIHRLLLPLPPPSRLSDLKNPRGRRRRCPCASRVHVRQRGADDIPNLVLPSVLRRLPDYLAIAEIRPCAGDGRGPVVALDSCENHNHPDRASRHAHQDGVRLGLRRLEARVS